MPKIEENIWITKDHKEIPMEEMTDDHLAMAFMELCTREYRVFGKINGFFNNINTFHQLRKKLDEVAKKRGLTLLYPDEKFPSPQWGDYFAAERRVKTMEPEKESTVQS